MCKKPTEANIKNNNEGLPLTAPNPSKSIGGIWTRLGTITNEDKWNVTQLTTSSVGTADFFRLFKMSVWIQYAVCEKDGYKFIKKVDRPFFLLKNLYTYTTHYNRLS